MGPTSVAASAEERARPFPGDALTGEALACWTHGVTIAAPPGAVWPWLVQMGAGRAGWYSWDALDNGGRASAEALVPAWGRVAVGDVLPMAPGATDAFVVERLEPGRDLVLSARHAGRPSATWEFLLEPLQGGGTRLLVRARVAAHGWMEPPPGSTPGTTRAFALLRRLPPGPLLALARAGHRVMQARQLRQLRRRAEGRRAGARPR